MAAPTPPELTPHPLQPTHGLSASLMFSTMRLVTNGSGGTVTGTGFVITFPAPTTATSC
jgi:hypothetical protein